MEDLKKELQKVVKSIREENKEEWGKFANDKIKLNMTKSQIGKKEFSVTSFKLERETTLKSGKTLEDTILNTFGKYGEIISIDYKYQGYEVTRYLFKVKED